LAQGGYIAKRENILMAGEIGTGNTIPTNDPTGPNCFGR
jgi:hypothetical protein